MVVVLVLLFVAGNLLVLGPATILSANVGLPWGKGIISNALP